MDARIDIDEEIKSKLIELANEINRYVNVGKYELYNKEYEAFHDKWKNDAFIYGCKYISSHFASYVELPQNEITEADICSALIRYKEFIGVE